MKKYYKQVPKGIKIGPRTFKVLIKDTVTDLKLEDNYGYTNIEKEVISIRDNLSIGLLRETLLHEVMHAVYHTYGNNETVMLQAQDGEDYKEYRDRWEHHFIEVYEVSLLLALQDNPKMMKLLLKK